MRLVALLTLLSQDEGAVLRYSAERGVYEQRITLGGA